MTFKYTFRVDQEEAMTVPYGPIKDDVRHNRGFIDLRGRPNDANQIAESGNSAALRRLLIRVAAVGSPIFTIGCDLGAHREPTNVPLRRREVAGGYIQFASALYDRTKTESYAALAKAIVAHAGASAGADNWRTDFNGKWVNFQFASEPKGIYPSLWIWFFAAARDPVAAFESRERLIEAIDDATALPATLQIFESSGRSAQ